MCGCRWPVLVVLCCVIGPTVTAMAEADWPSDLAPALEAYRAGDYVEARRLCVLLESDGRDERLRREAGALHALTLMRMPARNDRLDGRSRLAQLAQDDPGLLERPECQLADGIARLALNETGSAICQLDLAIRTFASRRAYERAGDGSVWLAEAWSRHNEWEVSLEHMGVRRPQSPLAARALRRAKMGELRERVAAWPGQEEAAARISLVLARDLITRGDGVPEGVALLEQLAGSGAVTPACAEACLALGQRYEDEGRWAEALGLYRRVQEAGLGEQSRLAEQRGAALSQAQIVLDVPTTVSVGQVVELALRVRNVDRVQLELRRVDLAGWLRSRQGRFAVGRLPVAGSVVLARELETRSEAAFSWWTSGALAEPLTCLPGPGAYVAVARAVGNHGRGLETKQLVLVSDLRAVVLLGRRGGLVWATGDNGATATADTPAAWFWMHGSFVPTQPDLSDGVGRFALPAEARLLRDKRWTCVVQAGEQLALCRGVLPAGAYEEPTGPTVVLMADPPQPLPGQALQLFGLLLPARGATGLPLVGQSVALDVVDLLGEVRQTASAEVSPTATFAVRLTVPDDWAGEQLSVIVRNDRQVLENVQGRFSISVPAADRPCFELACRMPPGVEAGTAELRAELNAAYPWGTPLDGAEAYYTVRAVRLPTGEPGIDGQVSPPHVGHGHLDSAGRLTVTLPVERFRMPPGPLAVGVWARVVGWDQRHVSSFAQTLICPGGGERPIHLWLEHEPPVAVVGDPLRFRLGWIDPGSLATGQRPVMEIWQGGGSVARPRLHPSLRGWESDPWRPAVSGGFEVVGTLPTDGGPIDTCMQFDVGPGEAEAGRGGAHIECAARFEARDGAWGVCVKLSGKTACPALVLVEAADVQGTCAIPSLDGNAELFVALDRERPAGARVLVVDASGAGLRLLASVPIRPVDDETLVIQLRPPKDDIGPGSVADVEVVCRVRSDRAKPAALFARLVDAVGTGHVDWVPGPVRSRTSAELGGLVAACSWTVGADAEAEAADGAPAFQDELAPELREAMLAGDTLWARGQPVADEVTRLAVPIPRQPGGHKLMVLVRGVDGAVATESLLLDARTGVRVSADAPEVLTVGDRSIMAVTLSSGRATAAEAYVSLAGGGGLHIESLRVVDGSPEQRRVVADAAVELSLEPGRTARVLARVEATGVGEGVAAVEVDAGGLRERVERSYQVFAPGRAGGLRNGLNELARPIRVKRSVLLLARGSAGVGPAPDEGGNARAGEPEWVATRMEAGERLTPGQWLLIRDRIMLDEAVTNVVWSQRLPAACVPPAFDREDSQTLGERTAARPGLVAYSAERLSAGEQVHECPLVVVRPGAYFLPWPAMTVEGRPVAVDLEPGERRIVVSDAGWWGGLSE